jgi:hypothetical protein
VSWQPGQEEECDLYRRVGTGGEGDEPGHHG